MNVPGPTTLNPPATTPVRAGRRYPTRNCARRRRYRLSRSTQHLLLPIQRRSSTESAALPTAPAVPDLAGSPAQQFTSSATKSSAEPPPADAAPSDGPSLQATPQLDVWTAKPDPLTQTVQIKPGKLAIPLGTFGEVIFPLQASNFAIVKSGLGKDTDYQVADFLQREADR